MTDKKISADPVATTPLGASAAGIQGGGNVQLPAALFQRGGNVLRVTTSGAHAVPAGTTAVIINLGSAGAVTLTLPKTGDQGGLDLGITDWAGNLTGLTLTPDAADTGGFMGVAGSLALGSSAAPGVGGALRITISPDATLLGWFAC